MKVLDQLAKQGIRPNYGTCLRILRRCISVNALQEGRSIHSCLMRNAVNLDLFPRNTLISMYNKCGGLEDIFDVFGRMPERKFKSGPELYCSKRKPDGFPFLIFLFLSISLFIALSISPSAGEHRHREEEGGGRSAVAVQRSGDLGN
ncbi:Pentatricopeptide repeat-containing protein [Nymphaea thermarum]|nr:Pentatricopeptide repeat-containing protein [Nymphaea thermarum]